MTPAGWVTGVALGCALAVAPVSAEALVVIRNATGNNASDFHIEFSSFADQLKLTSNRMGNGQTYPPPAPAAQQKTIDFKGGAGVPAGGELKIDGLRLVSGAGGAALMVTSWWWTGAGGGKLTGEPQVNIGGDLFTLKTLNDRNVSVLPVPEPATWAMMILGFTAIGAILRRRRVAAA